jgi:hypothetical protein
MRKTFPLSMGLLLGIFSSAAFAGGAKNIPCKRDLLISNQSEQEFLGETLEHLIERESAAKGYSKRPVIRRFSAGDQAHLRDLFTLEQVAHSELLMIYSHGVYDGACQITIRRARLEGSAIQGEQETITEYEGNHCAETIVYVITHELSHKIPSCDSPAALH